MPQPKPKTNSQSTASSALQRPAKKLEIVSISAPESTPTEMEATTKKAGESKLNDKSTPKTETSTKTQTSTKKSEPINETKVEPKQKIQLKSQTKAKPVAELVAELVAEPVVSAGVKSEKPKVKPVIKKIEAKQDPIPTLSMQAELVKSPSLSESTPEISIQASQTSNDLHEQQAKKNKVDKKRQQKFQNAAPIEPDSADIKPILFPCQAVGIVAGKYTPSSDEVFCKGNIITENGITYNTYVLGKAIKLLQNKVDLSQPHHFVVYPKTTKDNNILLEILAVDLASKISELDYNQFHIKGQINGQFEEEGFFLVQIQRDPKYVKSHQRDRFTIKIMGTLPGQFLRQFVNVKCELHETQLVMLSFEHLACPVGHVKKDPPVKKKLPQQLDELQDSTINPEVSE